MSVSQFFFSFRYWECPLKTRASSPFLIRSSRISSCSSSSSCWSSSNIWYRVVIGEGEGELGVAVGVMMIAYIWDPLTSSIHKNLLYSVTVFFSSKKSVHLFTKGTTTSYTIRWDTGKVSDIKTCRFWHPGSNLTKKRQEVNLWQNLHLVATTEIDKKRSLSFKFKLTKIQIQIPCNIISIFKFI